MYKHILVPIDGSPTAERGLQEATALAAEQGAVLHVIHVAADLPPLPELGLALDLEQYRQGLHRYGHDLLDRAQSSASARAVAAETRLIDAANRRPATAIVEAAKDEGCDLIVIGTHGRRGFSRAVMGSDAELVLRESPVPVLVVRGTDTADR